MNVAQIVLKGEHLSRLVEAREMIARYKDGELSIRTSRQQIGATSNEETRSLTDEPSRWMEAGEEKGESRTCSSSFFFFSTVVNLFKSLNLSKRMNKLTHA